MPPVRGRSKDVGLMFWIWPSSGVRGGSHSWDNPPSPVMGLTLAVWKLTFVLTPASICREVFRINWVISYKL